MSEIQFIHTNSMPPAPPRRITRFAETVSDVKLLILTFFGVVLICAALYFTGCQNGWGIRSTFDSPSHEVSFFDCLHFSIVTIATLGYGDYRPESYSRIVAAGEVLTGIVLAGVFVAQLVSRQQERLLKRLLKGQLNAEVQRFRDLAAVLLARRADVEQSGTSAKASEWLYNAGGLASSIARYWKHEANSPDLAEVIPSRAVGRLQGELLELLRIVESSGIAARSPMSHADRKAVSRLAEAALVFSKVLTDRLSASGFLHTQTNTAVLVERIRRAVREANVREKP